MLRPSFLLALPALLSILAGTSVSAHAANPDALWQIVNEQCVPDSRAHDSPAPCTLVDREHGFVLFKDRVGVAQYLLIPTARLAGIESPALLRADAPNYWWYGWELRAYVAAALGKPLADDQIGLEINSAAARSQLQLHIHMDCMRADIPAVLRTHRDDPLGQWQSLLLDGHTYSVMRLAGPALQTDDPFKLAAQRSAYAATAMGAQSLLLTGAGSEAGSQGFYLINMPVNFDRGEAGTAEVLLDHDCQLAR